MRKEVLLLGIKLTGGALKDFKEVPVNFTNGDEEERDPYIASVAIASVASATLALLYTYLSLVTMGGSAKLRKR